MSEDASEGWVTAKTYQKTNAHVRDAFAEYSLALHAFLLRRVRDQFNDADDLMQEVFIRYSQVDENTLVEDPGKYLFGIARRVVGEYWEKRYRGRVSFESDSLEKLSDEQILASDNPVEQEVLRRQRQEDLRRRIAELPWTHYRVLTLYMEDTRSYREIADELGITKDTVKCYLHDARVRLRMGWYE